MVFSNPLQKEWVDMKDRGISCCNAMIVHLLTNGMDNKKAVKRFEGLAIFQVDCSVFSLPTQTDCRDDGC